MKRGSLESEDPWAVASFPLFETQHYSFHSVEVIKKKKEENALPTVRCIRLICKTLVEWVEWEEIVHLFILVVPYTFCTDCISGWNYRCWSLRLTGHESPGWKRVRFVLSTVLVFHREARKEVLSGLHRNHTAFSGARYCIFNLRKLEPLCHSVRVCVCELVCV